MRDATSVQEPTVSSPGDLRGPAGNIVWLASYPKSGNTWFRVFLANLLGDLREPADINELGGSTIASARGAFDRGVGLEAADLTEDEIDRLRPRVYEAWSRAEPDRVLFHKIHDMYRYTPTGEPLVSVAATRGAIYLARNPLDVCVSWAHHGDITIEASVDRLCDPAQALCGREGHVSHQLRQPLSTWSAHVRSWVDAREIPVHLVRYEDLQARPLETFTAAVRFAGLDHDEGTIRRAIELSTFEHLRDQEAARGFREKARKASSFFRRGEVDQWKEALTPEQVRRLAACHGEVMRELGYLDGDGSRLWGRTQESLIRSR